MFSNRVNGCDRSCTNVRTDFSETQKKEGYFLNDRPHKYRPKLEGPAPIPIPNGIPYRGLTPAKKKALQVFIYSLDQAQADRSNMYEEGAYINTHLCAKIAGVHPVKTMKPAIDHAIKNGIVEVLQEYSYTPNGTGNHSRKYRLTEKYVNAPRTYRNITINFVYTPYTRSEEQSEAPEPPTKLDYNAPEAIAETQLMRNLIISETGALKYLKRDRSATWNPNGKKHTIQWKVNEEEYWQVMTSNSSYLNLAKAIEAGKILYDFSYVGQPEKKVKPHRIRRALASIMYRVHLLNTRIEIPPAGKCQTTNRVFSLFNQLPREIRESAYDFTHPTKPHRLIEADIRNSHPTLLALQMNKLGVPGSSQMLQDCINGIFHQRVMETGEIPKEHKEQYYKPLLNHFQYGRPYKSNEAYWTNPIRKIIAQTYSIEVVKYIDRYKLKHGHKSLPSKLMKQESAIIQHALTQLRAMHPHRVFMTVHDAIAFTDCDQGAMKKKVVEAIKRAYIKYFDTQPTIRVK